ncbi:MAG: TVP38/TMEM64 family protein [Nocardioidaceae bacterium]|nr:TVP38/TMEM64 family protein [Nocardioidaceae bacterium]
MWWRLSWFVVVVVASIVVALTVELPDAAGLRRILETAGWAAPVAFVGLYAVVTLAPVPKNVLSAVAGLLFGLVEGVLLVLSAAMLGALVAFGLGRVLGRAAVERFASVRVKEVDALLARRGLMAVVTVRLVPVVPFTAINYAAGLTNLRLRDYTFGTALGIIPGTVAYVTLGTYGSTPGAWPFIVSASALVALSVGGMLVGRRRRSPRTEEER